MSEDSNLVDFYDDDSGLVKLTPISEMYKEWFLDYAFMFWNDLFLLYWMV